MLDFLLAEPPAKEDGLSRTGVHGREVDQAQIEVLYLHSERMDLLDEACQLGLETGSLLLELGNPGRVEAAAVAAHAGPDGAEPAFEMLLLATAANEPLNVSAHERQSLVRLFRREETHWYIVPSPVPRPFPSLPLGALVLVALVLASCGGRDEPTGALPQPYPVTVQGAGEQATTVPEQPARIVALDSGPARLLQAMGAGDRLVGVPSDVRPGRRARVVVGKSGQADVEAIRRLQPDLIVATSAVDPLDVSRAQRQSRAALYVQPDSSLDDVIRATIDLGFLVGEPVRARKLAEHIRRRAARVEERIDAEPIVSTFVDTGFFITIPERSLLGDLIRRAHGESIAGEAPGPDAFPLSRLRRLDPDVYLATTESRVTLRELRADPRTAPLTAVEEGHFAILPSELVNEAGPRVVSALQRVARALHPNAFR